MSFNWRKAGFPIEFSEGFPKLPPWFLWVSDEWKHEIEHGVRGSNREHLANATLLFPTFLSTNYRAAILMGTFTDERRVQIEHEVGFLHEIADLIASKTLSQLEMIDFDEDLEKWNDVATNLSHISRRAVHPIRVTNEILQSYFKNEGIYQEEDIEKVLQSIHTLVEVRSVELHQPIEVIAAGVEEQYEFKVSSLADVVKQVVMLYEPLANEERYTTITIEDNIYELPEIEMDSMKIFTALSDIVDNAIKYCHEYSVIYIGGRRDGHFVEVYVDDFGLGIPEGDLDRIFNRGFQAERSRKVLGEEGDGHGLYHAKTIITVHKGEVWAKCKSMPRHGQSKRLEGYRVIITMRLPLSQPEEG